MGYSEVTSTHTRDPHLSTSRRPKPYTRNPKFKSKTAETPNPIPFLSLFGFTAVYLQQHWSKYVGPKLSSFPARQAARDGDPKARPC